MSMGWLKNFARFDPLQENLLGKIRKTSTDRREYEIEEERLEEQMEIEEECNNMIKSVELFEESLSKVVGLDNFKQYFRVLAKGIVFKKIREGNLGVKNNATNIPLLFIGNSGTGKTMAANVLGKLLYNIGIIDSSEVVELNPDGKYLTGGSMYSRPGIVVVNNLQRTIPLGKATEELESVIGNRISFLPCRRILIYTIPNNLSDKEWNHVAGFFRERMKVIRFSDYTDHELAQILHAKMKKQDKWSPYKGYKLHPECSVDAITILLEKDSKVYQRRRLNGLLVDMMLENACLALEARLSLNAQGDEVVTIKLEDLEQGLSSIENYP
ncbi:hypothetical protein ACHQM5_013229 [Ranunculus cassubicifolius]